MKHISTQMFELFNKLKKFYNQKIMFRFITFVSAVYFYHKYSKKYLGVEWSPSHNLTVATLVQNKSNALNFRIRKGEGLPSNSNTSPTESPTNEFIRILHPTKHMTLRSPSHDTINGSTLSLWQSLDSTAHAFILALQPDFSFVIQWKQKCFKFVEKTKTFALNECTDLKNSSFEIYEKI